MMNERLHAYYAAQVPSETCMVRLCNLSRAQKPKKSRAWLALPLAAACLLALVLVTQLRPARSGVTAPLATSAPTTQVTQPPAATTAPTDPPPQVTQYVESQQPEGDDPPATEPPAILPEGEGSGNSALPEPASTEWWWLGGVGGTGQSEPNSESEASLIPSTALVDDITGVYEDGFLIFTDQNTGESISIDLRDEPVEPGDNIAAIHAFGRDLLFDLLLEEGTENYAVYIMELPQREATP